MKILLDSEWKSWLSIQVLHQTKQKGWWQTLFLFKISEIGLICLLRIIGVKIFILHYYLIWIPVISLVNRLS
jgi:hypothetical protein